MTLSDELRAKIRSRAERAFAGEKVHRITNVTETHLTYRISGSLVGKGRRGGPNIRVRRDKIGRIYVPKKA